MSDFNRACPSGNTLVCNSLPPKGRRIDSLKELREWIREALPKMDKSKIRGLLVEFGKFGSVEV